MQCRLPTTPSPVRSRTTDDLVVEAVTNRTVTVATAKRPRQDDQLPQVCVCSLPPPTSTCQLPPWSPSHGTSDPQRANAFPSTQTLRASELAP